MKVLKCIIFFVCISFANADESVKTTNLYLRVISFSPVNSAGRLYYKPFPEKEETKELRVLSGTLPPRVMYKGSPHFALFEKKRNGDFVQVCSVNLGYKYNDVILVLYPKKDSDMKWSIFLIDAEDPQFKPGSRKIINLSGTKIRGEWGKNPFIRGAADNKRFISKPGSVITVSAVDDLAPLHDSQPIIVEFQNTENQWRKLFTTRWFHTPMQRHIVFVYFDSSEKHLFIKGVTESVKNDRREIEANKVDESKLNFDGSPLQK